MASNEGYGIYTQYASRLLPRTERRGAGARGCRICEMGDKIPADLRLVEVSADVKFDRSSLTG